MCIVIPAAGGLTWWTLLPLLSIPLALPLRRTVATRTDGPALNGALAGAGRLLGVFSALLAVGVLLLVKLRTLLRLAIPLREPFATANGVLAERELLVIRLEDDDGTVGFGEAAPLEPYDGVSIDQVIDALRDGPPPRDAPRQARAGWELAELDLQRRRLGRPLGEPLHDQIPVNLTLPAGPADEVAAAAEAGLRKGYSCFKVKVGLPDDTDRVRAVREAVGPWPAIRVDANGAWTPDQAVAALAELAPLDLELVEQPCATLEELAEVRARVRGHRGRRRVDRRRRGRARRGGAGRVRRREREAGRGRRLRPGARRAAGRARAPPGGVAVQHAGRPLGHRGRPAAGLVGQPGHGLRPGHAGAVRRARWRAPCPPPPPGSWPCPRARAWAWTCQTTRWPKCWSRKSASTRATASGCWSWGAWPACSMISARPSGTSRAIRRAASE